MKRRIPIAISVVGIAAILAMRFSTCSSPTLASGVLANARVGFTPSVDGTLVVRSGDRTFRRDLVMKALVDGLPATVDFGTEDGGFGGALAVEVDGVRIDARVAIALDAAGALVYSLEVPPSDVGDHEIAIALEAPNAVEPMFAAGAGEVADLAQIETRTIVLEHDLHPLAIVGDLDVRIEPGQKLVAQAKSIHPKEGGRAVLRVLMGDHGEVWSDVFAALGEITHLVHGKVTGARGRAHVMGLSDDGTMRLRTATTQDGRFEVYAPPSVVRWFAGEDVTKTSPPAIFVPGSQGELALDLSEGGELSIRVTDPDTGAPLTARIFVHGIAGTLDPSFGPDYRASGAGPLVDALRGEATTPLPAGKYRISATKGIEWSIDAKEIEIKSGKHADVELAPRHVVPTPNWVACDLHVHARPSFDSPVTPEDRVLSLVAAGVDFAVPTEHNLVGDYSPSLQTLDLGRELAFVPGVEVTTYQPFFGHFGVFPYPTDGGVPPFKETNVNKVFTAARFGNPHRFLQVHHPRMGRRIGYFDAMGWDRDASAPPRSMRLDFDAIEVMNGYELATPSKSEQVIRDWMNLLQAGRKTVATGSSDSHRIQYTWAGYPRTYVEANDTEIDPLSVVASLSHGRAVVTSGPIVDFDVDGAKPGEEITATATVSAHVRVRAAPWVDVTSVEIIANGKTVATLPVSSRPMVMGPEAGSLDEARARTVRFDASTRVEVGHGVTWIVAIVRGTRTLEDALPFMPAVPTALTNPVWVTER
jgi:hypothetical protein